MKEPPASARVAVESLDAVEGRQIKRDHPLVEFYRCPDSFVQANSEGVTGSNEWDCLPPLSSPDFPTPLARYLGGLPLAQRLDELRLEKYCVDVPAPKRLLAKTSIQRLYYQVRPLLPASTRRFLQRAYLSDWRRLAFPRWPVDTTVEDELEQAFASAAQSHNTGQIPFIWFWPDGALSALTLTHDVETSSGLAFIPRLMDVDDEFGFKASYQLVPQSRYSVSPTLLEKIRASQCEVNVHGLDHNINIFADRATFALARELINRFIAEFHCNGFRSPCMYRNAEWLHELDIRYDMSFPNVAHLEPQRGGCCTVFPYFIGNILELPLSTVQDYSLFHILKQYSIDLWVQQIQIIMQKHGLISLIIHPDYVIEHKAMSVYRKLLAYLKDLLEKTSVWCAMPGQIDAWWRQRAKMKLVRDGGAWRIEGEGSARARVAFARWRDCALKFECEGRATAP